jgi:hypothetical protein
MKHKLLYLFFTLLSHTSVSCVQVSNYPDIKFRDGSIIKLQEINNSLRSAALNLREINNFASGDEFDTNNHVFAALTVLYDPIDDEGSPKNRTFYINYHSKDVDYSTLAEHLILFESATKNNTLDRYAEKQHTSPTYLDMHKKNSDLYYTQNNSIKDIGQSNLNKYFSILEKRFNNAGLRFTQSDLNELIRKKEDPNQTHVDPKNPKEILHKMYTSLQYELSRSQIEHKSVKEKRELYDKEVADYFSNDGLYNISSISNFDDYMKDQRDLEETRNNQTSKLLKNLKKIHESTKALAKNHYNTCGLFKSNFWHSEQRLLYYFYAGKENHDNVPKFNWNQVKSYLDDTHTPSGAFLHVYSTLIPCNNCLYMLNHSVQDVFPEGIYFFGTLCTYDIIHDSKCTPLCRAENGVHKDCEDRKCQTIPIEHKNDISFIPWYNKYFDNIDNLRDSLFMNQDIDQGLCYNFYGQKTRSDRDNTQPTFICMNNTKPNLRDEFLKVRGLAN